MKQALELISELGIVPVVNIPDKRLAAPLAAALSAGGLPVIEVTFRNENAAAGIANIKEAYPDLIVGAGTILTEAQVDLALASGADFIVTPGLNPDIVRYCLKLNVPIVPGCATPTEVERGLALGLTTLKFFPSEDMGGVATIRSLCGPYSGVRFVATCGITLNNLQKYLAFPGVAAVGGSFMAPSDMVLREDWAGITALCKEAVRKSMGFRLVHVGVNGDSDDEGRRIARWFSDVFDMPYNEHERSVFAGTAVECTKIKFPGAAGHIAIGTFSVERAMAYLAGKGVTFREEFKSADAKGRLNAVYLEQEMAGFAIHLIKCEVSG